MTATDSAESAAAPLSAETAPITAGTLYIVSTPIGNDDDFTIRAVRILKHCDVVACEEIKIGARILKKLNVHSPLIELNEHTEDYANDEVIAKLLEGASVALISDCGTPIFADPGQSLLKRVMHANIPVVVVPGVTSIMTALVRSGLSNESFVYAGFLSRKPEERREQLRLLAAEIRTLVLLETPYRVVPMLSAVAEIIPNRRVYVGCNLTMPYESHHYGTVREIAEKLMAEKFKGEAVICIAGAPAEQRGGIRKSVVQKLRQSYNDMEMDEQGDEQTEEVFNEETEEVFNEETEEAFNEETEETTADFGPDDDGYPAMRLDGSDDDDDEDDNLDEDEEEADKPQKKIPVKPRFDNIPRPRQDRGDDRSERPRFDNDRRDDRGERPRFGGERPDDRGDRPRFGGGRPDDRGDRPRFGGGRPDDRGDRPRFGGGGRPDDRGDRPRFGGGRPDDRGDRPRFGGGGRPDDRGDRPRFGGGGRPDDRGDRPRFGGGRPDDRGDRPRFGGGRPDDRGDRPRFGGDGRPDDRGDRPRFGGDGRPDDRGDRPRFGGGRPDDRGDRPRFGGGGRPDDRGDRPRFGGGRPDDRGDRPRFGGDRPDDRGDRPRFGGGKPGGGSKFGKKPFGGGKPGGKKPFGGGGKKFGGKR